MKLSQAGGSRMTIPYNESGQRAFEVFYKVAAKLYAGAQAATNEYIKQYYPQSCTLAEHHADGKYHRTIQTQDGESRTISYDYRSKAIKLS